MLSFTKRRRALARPNGPQPGDILLFSHARGVAKLVPWFTKSRYYHCGLYEGGGRVLEARPNGVVRRDISRNSKMVFRTIPMPDNEGRAALDWAREQLGCKYDMMDVVFIVLRTYFPHARFPYANRCAFFCSEIPVLGWRHAGLDLFPGKRAQEIIPGDFEQFLPPDARDESLYGKNHLISAL
jgi:hypothetical protein